MFKRADGVRNCYNTGKITAAKEGGGISVWIGNVDTKGLQFFFFCGTI